MARCDRLEMSDKAEEIRDFLKMRRAMLDDVENPLNYFAFLGVPEDASSEMIKRAYFDLAKQIHPDRLDRLGLGDIKTEAGAIFQAITKAHEALSDIQQRLIHLKMVENTKEGGTQTSPEEEAKILTHRGQFMLRRCEYAEAEDFLTRALECVPDDPLTRMDLAWAIFHNPDTPPAERMERAKTIVDDLMRARKGTARAHFLLAQYYKHTKEPLRQKRHLAASIELDPNLTEAKREVRLMEMRKKREQSGLDAIVDKLKALWAKASGKSAKKKGAGGGKASRKR
jgi:curved DNA-binding protein CbpA